MSCLELCVFGSAGEGDDVADVLHAGNEEDKALETETENNDDPIYYRCTSSTLFNTNGLLPETLSQQLGCYGFEHLYYAGLLGKSTQHLLSSILVDYPAEAKKQDYKVEFKYSHNKQNQVQLCTFELNGEAVSVNYTY